MTTSRPIGWTRRRWCDGQHTVDTEMPTEHNVERVIRKSQSGRCGELLVQFALLMRGIEAVPMPPDAGVDLIAYAKKMARPLSIQVKTNLKAKPGGGKGKAAFDWWVAEDTPAQLIALVNLPSMKIWILLKEELGDLCQQKSGQRYHLYMYTDAAYKPRKQGRLAHVSEFEQYLLENRAQEVFGIWATAR
jgi:hypothetical protein